MCSMEAYIVVNYSPKGEKDYQKEIKEISTDKDYLEEVTASPRETKNLRRAICGRV